MSLYEIAVADGHQNERRAVLLPVLGNPTVARFRDAWVEKGDDGPVIAVYTRQGGGNRECYCESRNAVIDAGQHVPEHCYAACNEALAAHPLYLRDADDDLDATYATFYFGVPDKFRDALTRLAVDPVNMSKRWQAAIERIKTGELRPAEMAMADQFTAMLSDTSPDAPRIMEV
jgi:hypothetical protein